MKEIISVVALLATIYGGTLALKNIHDAVRRAALEKAAQGLPSLTNLSHQLREKRSQSQHRKEGGVK